MSELRVISAIFEPVCLVDEESIRAGVALVLFTIESAKAEISQHEAFYTSVALAAITSYLESPVSGTSEWHKRL